MPAKTSQSSPKRKLLFTVLMLLIPILFFVLLEAGLRLVGYGSSYPLVRKDKIFNQQRYVVNRDVAKRYFSLAENRAPEAAEDFFDIRKESKSLRVICLGGSTTAGFPYEINATFPFQLQYRLHDALFDHKVEVINLGISAVNSYTVLDLLPEVLALEPDVLVVYMGHNEFYGAHGVGSTQFISNNRDLTLAYFKIRQLRVVQLMQQIIGGLRSMTGSGESATKSGTLMQRMAADQSIRYDSEKFNIAVQNYRENLIDIVKAAKAENVPIFLSNLVSNLKDQPPFVSAFSDDLDDFTRKKCDALLLEGRQFLEAGEPEKAAGVFSRVALLDSSAADLFYYRGQSKLALGDSLGAFQDFSKSRDLDMLRFRAPSEFNDVIEQVAMNENVPLIDMEKVFRAASGQGIPGKELFLEHLHPKFDGYQLMAQTFMSAMREVQVINPPEPIAWKENLLTDELVERVIQQFPKDSGGVTSLDLEFGELQNYFLVNRWPFPESPVSFETYRPIGNEMTKTLAIEHSRQELFWDEMHLRMADYYLEKGDIDKARKEWAAIYYVYPENYLPIMKIADSFVQQERYRLAKTWYERALKRNPDHPNLLGKMGNLYIFLKQFDKAAENLDASLKNDENRKFFSEEQKANLYYLLAVSHANLKKWSEATDALEKSIALKPDFQAPKKLKSDIQNYIAKHGRN